MSTQVPEISSAGRPGSSRARPMSFGLPSLRLTEPTRDGRCQLLRRRERGPLSRQRHNVQRPRQVRQVAAQGFADSTPQAVAAYGRPKAPGDRYCHSRRCRLARRDKEHKRPGYDLGAACTDTRDISSPAQAVAAVHWLKTASCGDARQTVRRLRPFRRRRRRIARPLRVAMRARKPCRRLRRRTLGWYVRFIAGRGFLGRRRL